MENAPPTGVADHTGSGRSADEAGDRLLAATHEGLKLSL
jgi:hypothetical protein